MRSSSSVTSGQVIHSFSTRTKEGGHFCLSVIPSFIPFFFLTHAACLRRAQTALALIICNLLVIVTFVYRVCRRGKAGDLNTTGDLISLTNVDLNTGFTESDSADKQTTTADTLEEVLDSERSCSTA